VKARATSKLPEAYDNRASAREKNRDFSGAISDYKKTFEIRPGYKRGYNALAWLLATNPEATVRDGKSAVTYARKAAELTNWQDGAVLDTLAAAYAEAGNFAEAVKWETKALTFPEFAREEGDGARQRLKLYTERKPYRE
jgi:tetratricopeptide (TPR) repeat protein